MPTSFTMISPISPGPLLSPITPVGGIVIDLFGASGGRIEAGLGPTELFSGAIDPGTTGLLGAKHGFTPSVLDTLGGGLSAIAVRVTINGGGTGLGDSARGRDVLLVNGSAIGGFSSVTTQQTSPDGQSGLSMNTNGGFRSGVLDTGFFSSTDAGLLARIYASIESTGSVAFEFQSTAPDPRALDFTGGLASEIQNAVGLPILVVNPPIITDVKIGSTIKEGSTATIEVSAFNLHTIKNGSLTYEFDPRGDGSFSISNTTGTATIGFDRPGTYMVPIRVYNPDGARAVAQAVIEVENVAPTLQSPGDRGAVEGTEAAFALGSFSDPGLDSPWTVHVTWSDGLDDRSWTVDRPGDLGSLSRVFGVHDLYRATIEVTDALGLSATSTFQVNVGDVAPVFVGVTFADALDVGESSPLALTFQDPGYLDRFHVTVDWGDQTTTDFGAGLTARSYIASHAFSAAGAYQVVVTVVDLAGESVTARLAVTVSAAPIPAAPKASGPAAPRVTTPNSPTPAAAPPKTAAPAVLPTLSTPSAGALDFFNSAPPATPPAASTPPKGSMPIFPAFPGQGLGGNRSFSKTAREAGDGSGGRSLEEILAALLSARKAPIQTASASAGSGVAMAGDLNALVSTVGPEESVIAAGGSVESEATAKALAGDVRRRGKATRVMILVVAWTVSLRNQRRSSFSRRSNRPGRENAGTGGLPS